MSAPTPTDRQSARCGCHRVFWEQAMWLRYGVDADNTLVAIENVESGKTNFLLLSST